MRSTMIWCGGLVIVLAGLALQGIADAHGAATDAETYIDQENLSVCLKVSIVRDALTVTRKADHDIVSLEGWGYIEDAGKPMLPAKTFWVALPEGMKVMGVRETEVETHSLPGSYRVFPTQFPTKIADEAAPREMTAPDPKVYSSTEPYPSQRVRFMHQADLAGQSMAAIQVWPVQYIPATGELSLTTTIDIMIEGAPGYECGDYLPARLTDHVRATYENVIRRKVVNPAAVELKTQPMAPVLQGVAPGAYDYVIITQPNWVDDFRPLADWRTKLGLKATIVTTDWIYDSGGYSGSDLEKMRAFVIDAHSTWGTTYFVLGADTDRIPYQVTTITVPGYSTDDIPHDTYYADYDDDWVCEVHVGRISVRNAGKIGVYLSKVFTYEKSPPLVNYAKEAVFFGFDISTCGDMDGESFKEGYIRSHFPSGWTIDTEYDSESGTHKADVLAYLDQGYHLVNHHDHCNVDCMGTAWICHGDIMYTADIEALTNGDRQSILFAVGCNPARVSAIKCIGEASLRNAAGGCIAFVGNSFTGWGGPHEQPDLYSCGQDRYFYRNLFDLGITRLGENFTLLKNDEFDPDDPYNLHKYAFTQLHLLGDPGLTVWTDDPVGLTASHPPRAPVGEATSFTVEVTSGGTPVDGATVCLWKEGEVYEVGQTAGGSVTLGFTVSTEGTLYVTASKHNHIPYEGMADVDASASVEPGEEIAGCRPGIVSVVPNPFAAATDIAYALPAGRDVSQAAIEIYNCRGRHVRSLFTGEQSSGTYNMRWDGADGEGEPVASGIYYCEFRCGDIRDIRQILLIR